MSHFVFYRLANKYWFVRHGGGGGGRAYQDEKKTVFLNRLYMPEEKVVVNEWTNVITAKRSSVVWTTLERGFYKVTVWNLSHTHTLYTGCP